MVVNSETLALMMVDYEGGETAERKVWSTVDEDIEFI